MVRLALAISLAGILGTAGFALAGRRDDPRPGSRRALAVAELSAGLDSMHLSRKSGGRFGYSVAYLQRTHFYRALVIMGGTWPTSPTSTGALTTTATSTTSAFGAGAGAGTGPGSGNGSGGGTGVPPTTR